mgnify:CR=1 FL=1
MATPHQTGRVLAARLRAATIARMFSYRHAFHAGNHADVLKHTVLIATLQHLLQKDAALTVLDTHAGAGLYRLDGDYAANLQEDGQPFRTFRHSLFVLASVMSTARPGLAVLDAGHKAVAIERGLPTVWQQPDLRIVSAADEHARMEYPAGRATPEIGERLRLIPGHCDPTVDRFDWYVCVRAGRVESVWPITARGGMQ